jgi:hypothetical protein
MNLNYSLITNIVVVVEFVDDDDDDVRYWNEINHFEDAVNDKQVLGLSVEVKMVLKNQVRMDHV